MDAAAAPTDVELLELDIDVRMSDLWRKLEALPTPYSLETVAALMRAAYGKGYSDSFEEGGNGALFTEHGYPVPGRA
jgi:hypothetical protein